MKTIAKLVVALMFLPGSVCLAESAAGQTTLAYVGGTVYPSPTAAPVKDAAVLAEEGKVTAVEADARFKLPASAQVLDGKGKFIVAGFWNSHVHVETGWQNAAEQTADKLEAHMQEMLTRWAVTTAWDLGSLRARTLIGLASWLSLRVRRCVKIHHNRSLSGL